MKKFCLPIFVMILSGFIWTAPSLLQQGGAALTIENIEQIQRLFSFSIQQLHENQYSGLAWSPDSSSLAVGIGYGVEFYDTNDFAAKPQLFETTEWVSDIVFIPNSTLFVLGQAVYDLSSFEQVNTLPSYRKAFSSDGNQMAYVDSELEIIYLYDLTTEKILATFEVYENDNCEYVCGVGNLIFNCDGKRLAFAVGNGVFDVGNINLTTGTITSLNTEYDVFSLTFSPDNRLLAGLGGRYGYEGSHGLLLADADSSSQVAFINMVAENYSFNGDGDLLAVGGINEEDIPPNLDEAWGVVRFFDVSNLLEIKQADIMDAFFNFSLGRRARYTLFSPDGRFLATLDQDQNLIIWGIPE
jgi:WD40 repeat protein